MLIYGIKDKTSGKTVYVGQTIRTLSARWQSHLRDSKKLKFQFPLYRAIRKYGKDNFEPYLLEQCETIEQMDKREKELTQEFNTLTPNGYNLMLGHRGGRHCVDTCEKIRAASIKNGFGKWERTDKHNQENRQRIKALFQNPAHRTKFLIGNGSKEFDVYKAIVIQKRSPGKPSIYEKGEFVGTYLDVVQLAKEMGLNNKVINQVLRKEKKAHMGLIFEYKEK